MSNNPIQTQVKPDPDGARQRLTAAMAAGSSSRATLDVEFVVQNPPAEFIVEGLAYPLENGDTLFLLPDQLRGTLENELRGRLRGVRPYSLHAVHGPWRTHCTCSHTCMARRFALAQVVWGDADRPNPPTKVDGLHAEFLAEDHTRAETDHYFRRSHAKRKTQRKCRETRLAQLLCDGLAAEQQEHGAYLVHPAEHVAIRVRLFTTQVDLSSSPDHRDLRSFEWFEINPAHQDGHEASDPPTASPYEAMLGHKALAGARPKSWRIRGRVSLLKLHNHARSLGVTDAFSIEEIVSAEKEDRSACAPGMAVQSMPDNAGRERALVAEHA